VNRPVIHHRDHEHGGTDPILYEWEDAPDASLFIGSSRYGSGSSLTSYTVPKPTYCQPGDLILSAMVLNERSYGWSALLYNNGGYETFTDLFTDGYMEAAPPGTKKMYIVDEPSAPTSGTKFFVWVGWKFADSGDLTGSYTANVKDGAPAGVHGSDRIVTDFVVYRGPTGIDGYTHQITTDATGSLTTCSCPAITPTGRPAEGPFSFTSGAGGTNIEVGVTVAVTPLGTIPTILCAAISELGPAGQWNTVSPLVRRDSAWTNQPGSGSDDFLAWGERIGAT